MCVGMEAKLLFNKTHFMIHIDETYLHDFSPMKLFGFNSIPLCSFMLWMVTGLWTWMNNNQKDVAEKWDNLRQYEFLQMYGSI